MGARAGRELCRQRPALRSWSRNCWIF